MALYKFCIIIVIIIIIIIIIIITTNNERFCYFRPNFKFQTILCVFY